MKRLWQRARQIMGHQPVGPRQPFVAIFKKFQEILETNNQVLELIAEANDKLGGDYIFDQQYIRSLCRELADLVQRLINNLDYITPRKYLALTDAFNRIQEEIDEIQAGRPAVAGAGLVVPYHELARDMITAVGAKNANLAELHAVLGLRVPRGFAITTAAFHAFLDHNKLAGKIEPLLAAWEADQLSGRQAAQKIQKLILAAPLPSGLAKEIHRALGALWPTPGAGRGFLAVRSSAWGEDSELSFAGQYTSLLNVPAVRLENAYRQVLASAYSERALEYRRRQGFKESEVAMAVACQEMIDARSSGVLYTVDPQRPERDAMLIAAAWGLGTTVVAGRAADQFVVERRSPFSVLEIKVVNKENTVRPAPDGGTVNQPLSPDMQIRVCLSNDELGRIAECGMLVERYFKRPQDMEFAIDRQGRLVLLQARQLRVKPHTAPRAVDLADLGSKYPVLLHDQGCVAQKGIGAGPVFLIRNDRDLDRFPAGAIMVAKQASPILARALARAAGLITDVGSPTSHLGTIAREFRVPAILNTGDATTVLAPGREITIDAEENVVYDGRVKELEQYSFAAEAIEETYEYRLLRQVLTRIAPLNLLDPTDRDFTPAACRTLHDITRYIHEKAVEELIDRNYYHRYDPNTIAGRLKWKIPLDLVMIDIGGGLLPGAGKTILLEQVVSAPMQGLLQGLAKPGAWDNEPMSIDFGSFMSSLTRTFSTELASPRYVGQNLAVISRQYANVSLRLGYHFTMIDAYITDNINDNYAYFRFFGGVTDTVRRSRRAKFLGKVLAQHDFRVDVHGDLVVARVKKFPAADMQQRLYVLGLLVGFTRQLDVQMGSDRQITEHMQKFNTLLEDGHE